MTWQSPGTMYVFAQQVDELYQEIPTVALLPRNDMIGSLCKKYSYKKSPRHKPRGSVIQRVSL